MWVRGGPKSVDYPVTSRPPLLTPAPSSSYRLKATSRNFRRRAPGPDLAELRRRVGSLSSLAYVKKTFDECLCCSHVSDCHRAAAAAVLRPDIKVTQQQSCSE